MSLWHPYHLIQKPHHLYYYVTHVKIVKGQLITIYAS
jgi:hypothetical protein